MKKPALFLALLCPVQFLLAEDITLKQFITIAMQPVGKVMYVWGGGWNEADTGAGIEAMTIGVSPNWKAFFEKQDKDYDFEKPVL